jgi:threonine dehydrogenase-like Zn-dependent dehydrogenase
MFRIQFRDVFAGDRVVAAALIACFNCWACKEKSYSLCETTNPSKEMGVLYGDRCKKFLALENLISSAAVFVRTLK